MFITLTPILTPNNLPKKFLYVPFISVPETDEAVQM
jgi:hypothetical protein